jgi:hypothetical protein
VNLYYIVIGGEPLILVLYVDDLFITGAERLIEGCKRDLASEFDMKDIGLMHYFLGLEVWQEEGYIFLGQGRYAVDILSRFNMGDCKPMSTPMITNWQKISTSASPLVNPTLYRQLIGSLMYLVNTRPDICFAVNTLSQFMVEPRQVHWAAAKHVLRYLQGTLDFGLEYVRANGVRLAGYTDSDWAGSVSDRNSTSGCCFGLGSAAVSWFSRKQKSVALSSSEAEYMGTCAHRRANENLSISGINLQTCSHLKRKHQQQKVGWYCQPTKYNMYTYEIKQSDAYDETNNKCRWYNTRKCLPTHTYLYSHVPPPWWGLRRRPLMGNGRLLPSKVDK